MSDDLLLKLKIKLKESTWLHPVPSILHNYFGQDVETYEGMLVSNVYGSHQRTDEKSLIGRSFLITEDGGLCLFFLDVLHDRKRIKTDIPADPTETYLRYVNTFKGRRTRNFTVVFNYTGVDHG